jgi:hypothetical protein
LRRPDAYRRSIILRPIKHAIEGAGVAFIDENGGGPGVRLAKLKGKSRSR